MTEILEKALLFCQEKKHHFTKPRQDVLKVLFQASKPLGVYHIMALLNEGGSHQYQAQTIYRAIDFWKRSGFIHRIDSLNAYLVCQRDEPHQDTHFLICDVCLSAEEIHFKYNNLPANKNFNNHYNSIESHGVCLICEG